MAQYLFVYHGGSRPENPQDVEKTMAAWGAWFQSMGEAVAQPGAPVGMSQTVSGTGVADGGGANPASGYSVVTADSMSAASEMAKGCPMVVDGSGSVEVAEIMQM